MRRSNLGILAGIGLLILALILAARGAAPVAAQPLPPIATPQSAHVALTLTMSGSDGATGETIEFSMRGEGDVDVARQASRFAYELFLPADPAAPALPGTPTPEHVSAEIVVVDGRLYMRDAKQGAWTWSALPAGGDAFQLVPDADDWTGDWGGDAPAFMRVGPATLNGAATTRWRAEYDFADLLLADPTPVATPVAAPAPTMTVAVDFWIGDADAYVHRMTTEMRFAGGAEAGQGGSFALTMALDYSAFDQPVAIVAPDGATPAIDGAPSEFDASLFPSLSALPLDGSTFALPGGDTMIAGVFPGGGGTTIGRPWNTAGTPTPGNGRAGIRIGPTEPPAASRPSPTPRATATSAPPATQPRPTATVAVAANAELPPTVAAQPQTTAPAPRVAAARSNSRFLILGAAGLVVLCGLSGALIVAGRSSK